MNNFAHFGITDFVIAAGYKGEQIKDYFLNYESRNKDFTVNLGKHNPPVFHGESAMANWNVTVTDTGSSSLTGERVMRAAKYLDDGEPFMVTYGDGLSNVNIAELIKFHNSHDQLATVTSVRPVSRFGVLDINSENQVINFREKPQSDNWINVGYFVFNHEVLNYLDEGPLELVPLRRLAEDRQLNAFKHDGFWQPMDTLREVELLNEKYNSGTPPWLVN